MSKILLFILVLGMLLCSCGTAGKIHEESTVVIHDSVIFRDSTVYIKIPEESDKTVMPATDTSHLETSFASSSAWVEDGRIFHTLRNNEKLVPVKLNIPEYIHSETTHTLQNITKVIEVERKLKSWQKTLMWIGAVFLAIIIYRIVMFVLKLIKKI